MASSTRPNILLLMSAPARTAAVAAGSPCLKPALDALASDNTTYATLRTAPVSRRSIDT